MQNPCHIGGHFNVINPCHIGGNFNVISRVCLELIGLERDYIMGSCDAGNCMWLWVPICYCPGKIEEFITVLTGVDGI